MIGECAMTKAVFQLKRLTCPSCVKKIEVAFSEIAGVSSTNILYNLSKVMTEFDSDVVDASELADRLDKLGFPVVSTMVS